MKEAHTLPSSVSDSWRAGLAGLRSRLIDALLPPLCLACRNPVATPASLCVACWSRLTLIDSPCCDVLGIPFPYASQAGTLSPQALNDPPPFQRARAAVVYDEFSAPLVHAGKYGDRLDNMALMARMMARAGRDLLAWADLVIPVPLHWRRLWQRRYNQAAILAQALSRQRAELHFAPDMLRRVRATPAQASLSDARSRRRNVRRAFSVPDHRRANLRGKRILLVDDVMTTGATVRACTEALLGAGAAGVCVLVFALVLDERQLHI